MIDSPTNAARLLSLINSYVDRYCFNSKNKTIIKLCVIDSIRPAMDMVKYVAVRLHELSRKDIGRHSNKICSDAIYNCIVAFCGYTGSPPPPFYRSKSGEVTEVGIVDPDHKLIAILVKEVCIFLYKKHRIQTERYNIQMEIR